jgi:2-aminoadipate transaminase
MPMGNGDQAKNCETKHFSRLGRRVKAPPIAWLMEQKLKYKDLISLAAGFTDGPSLPVKEVRTIFKRITESKQHAMEILQYGVGAGREPLRALTTARIALLDAQDASHPSYCPDRAMITHGSQQFLYLLSEALFDEGDIALVEAPTYFAYLGIMQSFGVTTRSIPMDTDGINLNHLEKTLQELHQSGQLHRVKLLFMVSYFQNPTGITTSGKKKERVLQLIQSYEKKAGHPIYILEDAAYRELKFPKGPQEGSMLPMPHGKNRVIYSGTYSKPFSTGIRVGFGIVPEPLRTVMMRIKGNHDFGTSHLLQAIIEEAMQSGLYQIHLQNLQKTYQSKAHCMCESIRNHFPSCVHWSTPSGGLYVWATAPVDVPTGPESNLFKKALSERVLYVPGSFTYADDLGINKPDNGMRISFGNASIEDIQQGIERLGLALKAACHDHPA